MRINCKFAEYVLAPANAIPPGDVETKDGIACKVKFLTTWNNTDKRYDEELEKVCQERYGCSFSTIRSVWISRLGRVNDIWHLIRLSKK